MNRGELKYAMLLHAISHGIANMQDEAHEGHWREAQDELHISEEEMDSLAAEIALDFEFAQNYANRPKLG